MTAIMTLLLRGEADLLADHLSYQLATGVDHIIVTDNGSEDETPPILAEYDRPILRAGNLPARTCSMSQRSDGRGIRSATC
jgi:Glycosyl transferase family 2